MKKRAVISLLAVALLAPAPSAEAVVIDFESFADELALTTEVAGLTFDNATVLTSEISLGEDEFPPRSGAKVALDSDGAIVIVFAAPQGRVGGFFTYLVPLTLTAFNSDDAEVATATSLFETNLGVTGQPGSAPNEFLEVMFSGGITRVIIAGDTLAGSSFVLDDLTFTPLMDAVPVPEPSTLLLLAAAVGAQLVSKRLEQRRRGISRPPVQ